MNQQNEKKDTYIIPPNFIEGGSVFGGLFKIRNLIEACLVAIIIGVPVLSLSVSLTIRIIILCLTCLTCWLYFV